MRTKHKVVIDKLMELARMSMALELLLSDESLNQHQQVNITSALIDIDNRFNDPKYLQLFLDKGQVLIDNIAAQKGEVL